ncbi:hypothetical protein SLEP1_g7698 [Rubroshorea leprosula]|uniref:C2H2-type domain-containing protein n=1 Tax=Rubroshorea leprosula TaxID=152421 RepID=A0AAV5I513_9ROSI|nr:hypothetical protein SLEP1_g7698 [Rubroshorea leprosula]
MASSSNTSASFGMGPETPDTDNASVTSGQAQQQSPEEVSSDDEIYNDPLFASFRGRQHTFKIEKVVLKPLGIGGYIPRTKSEQDLYAAEVMRKRQENGSDADMSSSDGGESPAPSKRRRRRRSRCRNPSEYDGRLHAIRLKDGTYQCPIYACSAVLLTGQEYAAHTKKHYKFETEEEKGRRYAARRSRGTKFTLQNNSHGLTAPAESHSGATSTVSASESG